MYVETDASATFGGEEDWWGYRTPQGTAVAVCLRVPYGDAMLCASDPSSSSDWEHLHVIVEPWPVETFDLPRC